MKKLFLTSITAIAISCPAIATTDIASNAQSANCTEPVLGTTSGESNLQAKWTANTLNLQWTAPDADNWQAQNGTCTYDSGITVPQTNPSKTGYTFAGWRVKTAQNNNNNNQTPITLSSLYNSGSINVFASRSLNPGVYCEGSSGYDNENDDYIWYGTDEDGEEACSDSRFSGLNNGEWTVTMPNGNIVKGVATCSTTSGNNHDYQWGGNSSDWSLSSDALQAGQYSTDNSTGLRYCWCKATAGNTGSGYQSVAASSWVFAYDSDNAGDCAADCAHDCAGYGDSDAGFRRAVFGVAGD